MSQDSHPAGNRPELRAQVLQLGFEFARLGKLPVDLLPSGARGRALGARACASPPGAPLAGAAPKAAPRSVSRSSSWSSTEIGRNGTGRGGLLDFSLRLDMELMPPSRRLGDHAQRRGSEALADYLFRKKLETLRARLAVKGIFTDEDVFRAARS